jgi:hypothetical protein
MLISEQARIGILIRKSGRKGGADVSEGTGLEEKERDR